MTLRTPSGNEEVEDALDSVIDGIKSELEYIVKNNESKEIYFHDLIHEYVDTAISGLDRTTNLEIIDDTGHENIVDPGLVDKGADITTQIAQIAYECMYQELFETDIMQYLQDMLNNETVDKDKAEHILKEINKRKELEAQ